MERQPTDGAVSIRQTCSDSGAGSMRRCSAMERIRIEKVFKYMTRKI
jgi:hypothetical protein